MTPSWLRMLVTGSVRGLSGVLWWLETLPERFAHGVMDLVTEVAATTTWRGRMVGLAMLVGLVTLPAWAEPRLVTVMIAALVLACASQAWNLVSGFAGLLSLGHALFVGLGAYLGAGLYLQHGIGPWPGLGLVMGGVALVGTALGAVALRTGRPELTFAVLTLAGAEACRLGVRHLDNLGGTAGLVLPPVPSSALLPDLHNHPAAAYDLILFLTLATLVLIRALLRSGLGYRWRAVRENPAAAAAVGVNLFRTRLSAMAISAALTAPAGVFLAFFSGAVVADPLFSATRSMEIVLCAVAGGLGTVLGPVVGALALTPVDEGLAWLTQRFNHPMPGLTPFCYGLLLVGMVLFRPAGLWPWLAQRFRLVPEARPVSALPARARTERR